MDLPQDKKLDGLLQEGKITPEQYQELLANLPETPQPVLSSITEHKPWQVWFCSLFLLVVAIIDIFSGMFLAMVICVVISVPLFYRSRIAFIIIEIIGIATIVYSIVAMSIISGVLNIAFVIILSSAWKYYFLRTEK